MHRSIGKILSVVSVSKLLVVVNDTDEHDVDNVHKAAISRLVSWIKGKDHETVGHRGSRVSVEGTSVASSGQNETMGRQTDSYQAQFRGRLFSRPSKQSAAISSGGRRASSVRMYKRSRDGVPQAMRCQTLSSREICG